MKVIKKKEFDGYKKHFHEEKHYVCFKVPFFGKNMKERERN